MRGSVKSSVDAHFTGNTVEHLELADPGLNSAGGLMTKRQFSGEEAAAEEEAKRLSDEKTAARAKKRAKKKQAQDKLKLSFSEDGD